MSAQPQESPETNKISPAASGRRNLSVSGREKQSPARCKTEYEQALVRIVIVSILFLQAVITDYFRLISAPANHLDVLLTFVYLLIAITYLGTFAIWPGAMPVRRGAGIVLDISFLCSGMLFMGQLGALLYVVTLWVIFGNGFRYGQIYLMASALLALLGFGLVLIFSPFWSHYHVLGGGLFAGLIVLPLYVSFLIQRVEQARRNAEYANMQKSRFLANMSHEFRTPLNAIIGYSEMLMEEAEDHGYRGLLPDLRRIERSGHHLLTLINNLLDISKIEAGKIEIFMEQFDVEHIVREVITAVQPLTAKKSNELRLVLADDAGSMHSDSTKIRQILLNLLSNAAKFTQNGRITLRVRRENVDGHGYVMFVVDDTGVGMSQTQLDNLFLDFSQVSRSAAQNADGTGLGLAITRRLVKVLGGDVWVQSTPNRGSTFTVALPAICQQTDPGKGLSRQQ